MSRDDLVRNGKPESYAAGGIFRCKIGIVNLLLNFFGDANAGVSDFDDCLSPVLIYFFNMGGDINAARLSALLGCCSAQS